MLIEKKLEEMGIKLRLDRPERPNRVYGLRNGNYVYLSGAVALGPDGNIIKGKVGKDLTVEEANEGAKWAAVSLLSTIKEVVGDLDKVKQWVKLLCMVNTAEDFYDAPSVANGASDLIVLLYGERGRHSRSALGIACPAQNSCIEIEGMVEME